jgi:hypothetical protein
MKTVSRERP